MFKLYDCKLRIGGSVLNEIRKSKVTAPEIEVLRALHGSDAVLDIVEAGEVKRSDREERARLEDAFAHPSQAMGESLAKKKRMLADLFGHATNALPKAIEAAAVEEDEPEADEMPIAPASRTRVTKSQEPSFAE